MWAGLRYIGSEELLAVEWFEHVRDACVQNFSTFPIQRKADLFEVVVVEIKVTEVL